MKSIFPKENKYMGSIDYLKLSTLEDGEEVRIRILGGGIVGWEDWTLENKPVRFRAQHKPSSPINPEKPIREFFACCVWNYSLERVQIWYFTQKKVKNSLKKMEEKRGLLTNYDVRIVRSGEDQLTQYVLFANKDSHAPKAALESLHLKPINLCALYEGKDPWKDLDAGIIDEFDDLDSPEDSNDTDVA